MDDSSPQQSGLLGWRWTALKPAVLGLRNLVERTTGCGGPVQVSEWYLCQRKLTGHSDCRQSASQHLADLSRPAQLADCAPGHGFAGVARREGAGAGRAQAEFAQDVVERARISFGIGPV